MTDTTRELWHAFEKSAFLRDYDLHLNFADNFRPAWFDRYQQLQSSVVEYNRIVQYRTNTMKATRELFDKAGLTETPKILPVGINQFYTEDDRQTYYLPERQETTEEAEMCRQAQMTHLKVIADSYGDNNQPEEEKLLRLYCTGKTFLYRYVAVWSCTPNANTALVTKVDDQHFELRRVLGWETPPRRGSAVRPVVVQPDDVTRVRTNAIRKRAHLDLPETPTALMLQSWALRAGHAE